MSKLLLVEDDPTIGEALLTSLRGGGFDATWVTTGTDAVLVASREPFDLVILDLGLPDIDGYEVCRTLRGAQPHTIIVMLTARQDEMDIVTGLESGADDYLTKPFRLVELLARVRAHLRRASSDAGGAARHISVGSLDIDVAARTVSVDRAEVQLRAKEFELLVRLATVPGSAVSREDLMNDVWDENWFGSTKTLDVHVASLRRKLGDAADAAGPQAGLPTIATLRGYGYRLDAV